MPFPGMLDASSEADTRPEGGGLLSRVADWLTGLVMLSFWSWCHIHCFTACRMFESMEWIVLIGIPLLQLRTMKDFDTKGELWIVCCEFWAVSYERWVVSYERWAVAPHCSKDSVVCKAQCQRMNSAELSEKCCPLPLPRTTPSKTDAPYSQKREKAKNYWLVNISWRLGRFIKNEKIKFETYTFLDDLVDLSRMRKLSSKQSDRMVIEHASRCVLVFYDLMKCLLFKEYVYSLNSFTL